MAGSSSRCDETNTLIDFRWNLFSATAIFQTSMGARRIPKKTKRRGRAVVKPAKRAPNDIFVNLPLFPNTACPFKAIQEHSFPPAQLAPAVTTDTRGKLLSSETRRMQEDIRAHYQEHLEQRADRESLHVLEIALLRQAEALAEEAALEDLRSLALLDRTAARLNNKLTHCTPPYQPTLWQRPTRETSSASQEVARTPPSAAKAESSQHTLGSSYAIFSSKAGHEELKCSQQGSKIARLDKLVEIDPLGAEAQNGLEAELAEAVNNSASASPSRKRDETQTSSSPSRSMRASGKVDRWLGQIDEGGDARSEYIPEMSQSESSRQYVSEGKVLSLTVDDEEGQTLSPEGDEDQCQRFDFGTEAQRELNRLNANIRDLVTLSETSIDLVNGRFRGAPDGIVDWKIIQPRSQSGEAQIEGD